MHQAARVWSEQIPRWGIPQDILDQAPASPWVLPPELLGRFADEALTSPTPSRSRALPTVPQGGSVLDVGCGSGAASLPLAPPADLLIGVDEREDALADFAARAAERGARHVEVMGRWPDVAPEVEQADVVVCHHVLYNVPDITAFVTALTTHARHTVVLEISTRHPRHYLNPLWRELWGLERPEGPTGDDALAAIRSAGFRAERQRWEAPFRVDPDGRGFFDLMRRMLCLRPERDAELRAALERFPIPRSRQLDTIWWDV